MRKGVGSYLLAMSNLSSSDRDERIAKILAGTNGHASGSDCSLFEPHHAVTRHRQATLQDDAVHHAAGADALSHVQQV